MSIDAFYTTMAGLQAVSARMDALSSNLANLQTPGYSAVQALKAARRLWGRMWWRWRPGPIPRREL
jgi:flagellar basal body rod protein FlgG